MNHDCINPWIGVRFANGHLFKFKFLSNGTYYVLSNSQVLFGLRGLGDYPGPGIREAFRLLGYAQRNSSPTRQTDGIQLIMAMCPAQARRLLPKIVRAIARDCDNDDSTLDRFVILCQLYIEAATLCRSESAPNYESRSEILDEIIRLPERPGDYL